MTPHRIAAYVSAAVVAAAIAAGLYLSGSPGEQRLRRLDERRVADLQRLSSVIDLYHTQTGQLPAELERLIDGRRLSSVPRDPATDEPYEFRITGDKRFELCAEFSRGSPAAVTPADNFWRHDAGRRCFEFDYSDRQPLPNLR